MNFLTDPLPNHIVVNEREVRLNTDFRFFIEYYRLISSDSGDGENLTQALETILPDGVPADITDAIEPINEFIRGGKVEKQGPPKKLLGLNNNLPFDFDEDDRLIWSAFYKAYRINLHEARLHWWEFLELLEELPEECRLEKVIHYRTIDLNNPKLGKEQKNIYRAMQNTYKIKPKKTQEDEDFERALREGKDPNLKG